MRFRTEQHLRRPGDIGGVRQQGRRIDCQAFTVWWKPRETGSPAAGEGARVCVIASAAAVGGAIQRNRAKRRLRELFRHQQALVPPGCDLLLIARAAATKWPMPELEKKFGEACRRMSPGPKEAAS